MSRPRPGIIAVLLPSPVHSALRGRFRAYRVTGASWPAAAVMIVCVIAGWLLLRFEAPGWRRIRQERGRWYPHISATRPRPLDLLRYLLQTLWLLLIIPAGGIRDRARYADFSRRWRARLRRRLWAWYERTAPRSPVRSAPGRTPRLGRLLTRALLSMGGLIAAVLAGFCISQPFGYLAQFVFVLLLWGIAMIVRDMAGRFPALMLIVLSLTVSCRYLWWRYTATLNWSDPVSLVWGLLLLGAETYSWTVLVLGYFQTLWPLNRLPAPMPKDIASWPTIDVLIPTYNEHLSVVKPTLYSALGIDWPKEKITIYVLDDGNRPEFAAFAREIGVEYIARPNHEHAKAGNINYALKQVKGELVAIFDCDHVPTRSFLQLTVGWFFKDPRLGMLQTPHHFFSPDPFERNLGRIRRTPNEGKLFYGLVQDGNDLWDASFFCGSCAVLRRSALDNVGGIAVETVTEDAHTSLRMHRHGYSSAYIRIPQAAGLATESLSAHVSQRIRWARGMVQIFRIDNPLFGKGLKLAQRLCYANAMLHFLAGIPRLIFLTAPLAFLLLHAYIIYAPAVAIALYVLPHMVHASLTTSRVQGKYRHSFWSEIYETVLAWYIARPTTMALLNPHAGRFNVTAKGRLIDQAYIDWKITRPYLVLMLVNVAGLVAGAWRLTFSRGDELLTVVISLAWVLYNLIILGGAIAVAFEAKQIRAAHRVDTALPAAIATRDGHIMGGILHDFSDSGAGLEIDADDGLQPGQVITLLLSRGRQEYAFPCRVSRASGRQIGVQLAAMTTQQHVDYIQCTFARADSWVVRGDSFPEDKPLESLGEVLSLGARGYLRMLDIAPPALRPLIARIVNAGGWVVSFLPRNPQRPGRTDESTRMTNR